MHPIFHVGPIDFPAYYTFLTMGYMLVVLLAWRETWKMPEVDPTKFIDLAIILLLAGLVGARILHVIADGYFWDYVHLCTDPLKTRGRPLPGGMLCTADQQCASAKVGELCNVANGTCHQARDCLRVFKIWYGGLAFYGGLFLAALVGVLYIRHYKGRLALGPVADLAGFGIPLGLVFGRLGCWFSGCCFGRPTDSAIGVVFPFKSPTWERHVELHLISRVDHVPLPVIPTQLFHVASNFLIFLICYLIFKRWRRFNGFTFWVFLALYGVSRFILEFWRDDHRGVWLGGSLSTSQLLGIPVILLAVWGLTRKGKPKEKPEEAPDAG